MYTYVLSTTIAYNKFNTDLKESFVSPNNLLEIL